MPYLCVFWNSCSCSKFCAAVLYGSLHSGPNHPALVRSAARTSTLRLDRLAPAHIFAGTTLWAPPNPHTRSNVMLAANGLPQPTNAEPANAEPTNAEPTNALERNVLRRP